MKNQAGVENFDIQKKSCAFHQVLLHLATSSLHLKNINVTPLNKILKWLEGHIEITSPIENAIYILYTFTTISISV